MKYNTAVFDLDGTVLNTLDDLANAVNYSMKECGYPTHSIDTIRGFIGNGIDILIRRSIPKGCTEEQWLNARDIFKGYYSKNMLNNTRPYEGIEALLKALKENKVKTAIVTNKNHDMANNMIADIFPGLFDVVIGTDLSKRERKPAPDGVYAALELLGEGDAIYIGDTEVDVETAHNAGLKCIGVMWGFRKDSFIKGADFVVNSPEELEEYFI